MTAERRRAGSLAYRGIDNHQKGVGSILVATQVVEVSLNVDFDVLYSDPGSARSFVAAVWSRQSRASRAPPDGKRVPQDTRRLPCLPSVAGVESH